MAATATSTARPPRLTAQQQQIRVAVYTRQSVARDGEFGSLQAQREAIESYVRSQPGWQALPQRYDDAGFSGGTTERPAFQRLLQDIEAGGIDAVAVYKLDRLSRSIGDFVRLMDLFARHEVRFVSTTQAFDTSTSVGRMTVNLLATFAAFEREVIAERTRDKMAAARRRGLWTGGPPVLGYRVVSKRLTIVPQEAEQVREIFASYLSGKSLLAVAEEINHRGWTTKPNGRRNAALPGRPYDKAAVRRILTNVVYLGKVRYRGEIHDGAHDAIIDAATWDAAQKKLAVHAKQCCPQPHTRAGGLLKGLLRCAVCGQAMTLNTTRRGSRRFAYYVCKTYQRRGPAQCPGSRVAVKDVDAAILERLKAIGADRRLVGEVLETTRRQFQTKGASLHDELTRLEDRRSRLLQKQRSLLDTLAADSTPPPSVHEKLGELGADLDALSRSIAEVKATLATLQDQNLDEDDLRSTLRRFDPVWNGLGYGERARLVELLIERVVFDGRTGEVDITFRPHGIKSLIDGANEKEEAACA